MPDQQALPLKDIHLPDPVSWWPPAPGYWLLLGIVIILVSLFLLLRRRQRQRALKKLVLRQFDQLCRQYRQQLDDKKLVNDLSVLLRRTAISYYPREEVASLSGEQWLAWLDKLQPETAPRFSTASGQLLNSFNYSAETHSEDIEQLLLTCEHWFKQLPDRQNPKVSA